MKSNHSVCALLATAAIACGGPAFNDACPDGTHAEGKDCVRYVTAGAGGGSAGGGHAGSGAGVGGVAGGGSGPGGSSAQGGSGASSAGASGQGGAGAGNGGTFGKGGASTGAGGTGGVSAAGAGGGAGTSSAGAMAAGGVAGAGGAGGAGGGAGTGAAGASGIGGAAGAIGAGAGGVAGAAGAAGAGGSGPPLLACAWEGAPGTPHTIVLDLSSKSGVQRKFARPPISERAGINGVRIFATEQQDASHVAPMKVWTVGLLQSAPLNVSTVKELPWQVQRVGGKVVLLTILNNAGATNEYNLVTIADTDADGSGYTRDALTTDLLGRSPDGGAVFPDGSGGWFFAAVLRESAQAALYVEHWTGTALTLTTPRATAALTEMTPLGFVRTADAVHAFLKSQATGAITQYSVPDSGAVTMRVISPSDVQMAIVQGSGDTFDYTYSDSQSGLRLAVEPLANVTTFTPAAAPPSTWPMFGSVLWQQGLALSFGKNQAELALSAGRPLTGAVVTQTLGPTQLPGGAVNYSQPIVLNSTPTHLRAGISWVESATDAQGSYDALVTHTLNCQ